MAKRKPRVSNVSPSANPAPNGPSPSVRPAASVRAQTTGRYLVLFRRDAADAGISALKSAGGIKVTTAPAAAERSAMMAELTESGRGVALPRLGIAVVNAPPEQLRTLGVAAAGSANSAILAVEPERYVYAMAWLAGGGASQLGVSTGVATDGPSPRLSGSAADYLRGYREAVMRLTEDLLDRRADGAAAGAAAGPAVSELEEFRDTAQATWGLQATQVVQTRFSGRGVRISVLDTGFDLEHPDFFGRAIVGRSFIDGDQPTDIHDAQGHGTHTAGTAAGPESPSVLPRYGVAFGAEMFLGKVLDDSGTGTDGSILDGIEWGLENNCQIISMSLGAPAQPGDTFSPAYEAAARRALEAGTLIVAAAGNDSRRPQGVAPVSHPANCPSIMAVAALDQRLRVAFFSNRGINPAGGQVDIAGPGVGVRSSFPLPKQYEVLMGTSMATPHVAGIAALYAEADARARGEALWARLTQTARRIDAPSADAGAGLVQAP